MLAVGQLAKRLNCARQTRAQAAVRRALRAACPETGLVGVANPPCAGTAVAGTAVMQGGMRRARCRRACVFARPQATRRVQVVQRTVVLTPGDHVIGLGTGRGGCRRYRRCASVGRGRWAAPWRMAFPHPRCLMVGCLCSCKVCICMRVCLHHQLSLRQWLASCLKHGNDI